MPAATPPQSRKTIWPEFQPSRWPSARPVIRPSSAAHSRKKPSQSNGGIVSGIGLVGMKISPIAAARAQKGNEMKNT